MKKIFTLCISATILFSLAAQSQVVVPNGNMESWTNFGAYKEPLGWGSPNSLTSLIGVYECYQSTDVSSGTYAAKLVSNYVPLLGIVVPGVIGTGTIDASTQTVKGGFPLNDPTPQAVIGYFKYTPSGSDSCLVYSILTHWDTNLGKRDTVAVAAFMAGNTPNYTLFTAPFYTLKPGVPDSAFVLAATTSDVASAQDGSTMYVDDIDFTNGVGVHEIPSVPLGIYPNPSDKELQITVPKGMDAASVIITNVAGTHINQYRITTEVVQLNTAALVNGMYVAMMKNSRGETVASGKFSVQH